MYNLANQTFSEMESRDNTKFYRSNLQHSQIISGKKQDGGIFVSPIRRLDVAEFILRENHNMPGALEPDEIIYQLDQQIPYTPETGAISSREGRLSHHVEVCGKLQEQRKNSFEAHSAVPPGANTVIDPKLLRPYYAPLGMYQYIEKKGCIQGVPAGTQVYGYNKDGQVTDPIITMSLEEAGMINTQSSSNITFQNTIEVLPIPTMYHHYVLSEQQIQQAQSTGNLLGGTVNLEFENINAYSQSIYSNIETMIFYGAPGMNISFQGSVASLNGIWQFPGSNDGGTLTLDVTDPTGFYNGLIEWCSILLGNNVPGPYTLFLSQNLQTAMSSLFVPNYPLTTLDYFLQYNIPNFIEEIVYSYMLGQGQTQSFYNNPTGYAVLMPMRNNIFDMCVASPVQSVMISANPAFRKYLMFGSMAPRPKTDAYGNCGILSGTIEVSGQPVISLSRKKFGTFENPKERLKKIKDRQVKEVTATE